jgi:hypothetical protein
MIIISRSSIYFKHLFENNDVAYYSDGIPVTFAQIRQNKIDKQRLHLKSLIRCELTIKPCYLWAFYNDTFPYGGWWLYVKCCKIDFAINFKNEIDFPKLAAKIISCYPLGFLPMKENFYAWIRVFEKSFHKDCNKREKNAVAPAWCSFNWRGLVDIKRSRDEI